LRGRYPWADWTLAMRLVHPSVAGVSSWSPSPTNQGETSAGHAGVPKEREPRSAPRSPPPHLALRLWPYNAAYPQSTDLGATWDLVGQVFTPFSPGDPTKHPACHPWVIAHPTDRDWTPTSALQTREDPGAHARPNRGTPRSTAAWPLRRRPCGTTLAAYPSRRRVRAATSVRRRTRTGRIWFIRTAPFET
jgi:hypothetical protein